tara:strand:- start:2497 stop:3522 length:1026 start_codon:yes stop_codon:yes gene_type:complete
MVAAVETMAWTGDVPWHGEGVKVDANLTPKEMMVAAGLDWSVSKRPGYTIDSPVYGDDSGLIQTPNSNFIVRDTDNSILGHCGANYLPVQNERIFDFFQKFAKETNVTMETAGSLRGGKDIWALAKLNGGFELPGGDEINDYLLFRQPHEPGHKLLVRDTEIRVVCNNTLQFALGKEAKGEFRMSHIHDFNDDMAREAAMAVGLMKETTAEFQQTAEFLSKKKAQHSTVLEYVARIYQPAVYNEYIESRTLKADGKKVGEITPLRDEFSKFSNLVVDALEQSPGANLASAKGTWWGAVNAVTYVEDHMRTGENRVYNALFGDSSKRKTQALGLAVDYAKAA